MSYTVNQLAKIAFISVRTLHYYDEIGLLNPSTIKKNGYRVYEEKDLLKLQQILFFRELDFPLLEIKKILSDPQFNMETALKDQRKLIEIKRSRLENIIKTINKTIKKINKETSMKDEELYNSLSKEKEKEYAKEAKERWGHTEAWKQSQERTKNWTQADYDRLRKEAHIWMKNFAEKAKENKPESDPIQALIGEHYNSLRTFYEPNIEMYRGLANMYVDDPRFAAFYEKYASGLSIFMRDAMHYYCDHN